MGANFGDESAIMTLHAKVAIVTGGGQGLGESICWRLAQEGCSIVVADLNPTTAQQVAEQIRLTLDQPTWALQTDVTDETEVQTMIDSTAEHFGRIDILVANAGIVISKSVLDFPVAEFQRVVDVNLTGYFLCAKYAARVMKAQRSGSIIQINTIAGRRGSRGNPAYVASKFAGIGLTQSLALELAESGVRVNAICPGHLLDSPLWHNSLYEQYAKRYNLTPTEVRQKYLDGNPMKRGCTYEDVCHMVAFLASDQSSYMTGQAINVSGGEVM